MIHIMSHNVTISMIWCGSDALLVKTFINLSDLDKEERHDINGVAHKSQFRNHVANVIFIWIK